MKFRILTVKHDEFSFRIEEDLPQVGAYLYVYKNNICIKDYLQNDVEACKEIAREEYGVPIEKWKD